MNLSIRFLQDTCVGKDPLISSSRCCLCGLSITLLPARGRHGRSYSKPKAKLVVIQIIVPIAQLRGSKQGTEAYKYKSWMYLVRLVRNAKASFRSRYRICSSATIPIALEIIADHGVRICAG